MCRSIKRLNLPDHHATSDEVQAATLQFVRKISGMRSPSKINEPAFNIALVEISHDVEHLLAKLEKTNHKKPK